MTDDSAAPTGLVYGSDLSPWSDPVNVGVRRTGPRNMTDLQDRAQAMRALQGSRHMLYAIRTHDGLIKVGCSKNVAARRRGLGDEILAVRFGDFDDESAMHELLRPHLARGQEYYTPHVDVIAVVNEMRVEIGLEPLSA